MSERAPMRLPLLATLALCASVVIAQPAPMDDEAARQAIHRIVRCSGLQANFIVRRNEDVKTAVAFIRDRQRVIEYDPAFIAGIIDSTHTDLGAISVLAHEVAHHLLGHTLDPAAMHPGDELACDLYSGFVLRTLGATLAESRAAMELTGDPHGTRRHPPRTARLAAIEQGWRDADNIARGEDPGPPARPHDLRYVVSFVDDVNTYYVDSADRVIWFDDLAAPIEFGSFSALPSGDFAYQLTWGDQVYFADRSLAIWRRTEVEMPLRVGRLEPFEGGR